MDFGPNGTLSPRPTAGARRGRRAFTLLEVLVALAIFAMASVMLASAYVNILNGYEIVQRGVKNNEDVAFARTIVLREPDRTKLEQGGEFDSANNRHVKWGVEIASTNEADLFTATFTCEVSDPTVPGDPEKTVETFTVLRPTWTVDQAEHDKLRENAKSRILEIQGKQQQ